MRGWLLMLAASAACSSAPPSTPAPAAAPAPAPAPAVASDAAAAPASTPLVWEHSRAVEPDSNGCEVLRLRVKKGGELLAEARMRDACEADPSYHCKDTGEGCETSSNQLVGWLELGGRSFAWVKHTSEWHDNGAVGMTLYGYGCGTIKRVYGVSWQSPTEETRATLVAEDGDWKRVLITETDPDGSTHEVRMVWDEELCVYALPR